VTAVHGQRPAANLLNAPFVATEVLNILVGSFAVVAVAVAISALLYRAGSSTKEMSKALNLESKA